MMALEFNHLFFIGLGFILSLAFTPIVIHRLKKLGLTGIDLHKEFKKDIPNIGGIGVAVAFTIILIGAFVVQKNYIFLIALIAFLLSAVVGLYDDIMNLRPVEKLILGGLASVPLFLLIPLDVFLIVFIFGMAMILSNWSNMLKMKQQ